ncbi:glycosyltransferase family 39 protein [Mycolicibacterium sp. CBM1]
MSITVRVEPVTGDGMSSGRLARPFDAVWVGLFATAFSAAGAARPSFWFDEAATISASTRPVPDLWRLLGNIDAVHGLYYLLMHGWFSVFPATEFWSRVSSSLAVGVAAAGVVVLGRLLSTRAVAVTAGMVFAVLPRVTWAGMETRSYALSLVAGAWLTVLCVVALRRNRARWWLTYSALMAVAVLLNVFLVLLLAAHAVLVAVLTDSRSVRRWWTAVAAGAAAVVAPFLVFAQGQLFQVGWISPLSGRTVGEVLQNQYFDHATPFAILAGAVIATALLRRFPLPEGPRTPGPVHLIFIALAWIVIPTAALVLYSVLRHPVYYPRYLSFTVPAIALLLALCIVAVGRSSAGITVVLLLFGLAATPNYLAQRGQYAKEAMDYSQVADVITRYAASGDCLIMDNTAAWKPGPIRPLLAARPAAFAKLHDYGRGKTAIQRNMLWDSHIPIWRWSDKLWGCPAVWTVTERDATLPAHQRASSLPAGPRLGRTMAYQVPSRFGFHVVERWQFSFAQVTKSIR